MKNLKCLAKEKFGHMLGYLVEMGYDLALAPGDVVSTNPGFESVLGVYECNSAQKHSTWTALLLRTRH